MKTYILRSFILFAIIFFISGCKQKSTTSEIVYSFKLEEIQARNDISRITRDEVLKTKKNV